ncbi:hypothetical protein BDN67DRAFT_1004340 [Paxillus ammoniavirescens]|nr:hypothetical protein BDN67DRAFT_1004340 [Paxillus ammoniavirescens]
MPSSTKTTHSPTKKFHNGAQRSSGGDPSRYDRGPTRAHPYHQPSKRKRKPKAAGDPHKPHYIRKNALLNRLSPQSPTGKLLDRIGVSIKDDIDDDQVEDEEVVTDLYSDLPDSAPHFYTPDPGEVERFLESVVSAWPAHWQAPITACPDNGTRPTLAVETHNPSAKQPVKVEDLSSSVLYSPTETAVNSLLSSRPLEERTLDPLLGDMTPPSASVLEECRNHLVPVLLASAKARGGSSHLDSEQCAQLLSDDRCRNFFRQARETKHQISSLVSAKTPTYNGLNGNLKRNRDRVDETSPWSRNTRRRFNSMDTVVSEGSRRDSEITLVDFPAGRSPPKAPRAMLQASHSLSGHDALVSSPTRSGDSSQTSLITLVREAIRMFPTLTSTSQPAETTEPTHSTTPNVQVTGAEPGDQFPASVSPSPTDFISHQLTQPGIWFKQQGRKYSDIVDIDVDVGEDLFMISEGYGNRPRRIKMGLRLCSLPGSAKIDGVQLQAHTPLEDIETAIQSGAMHWPRKGTLVIQVNPDSQQGKTWLPWAFESTPLDVTSCMLPGKNTFRFIHLSDSSDFTFVLVASPLLPDEEWRSWDWSSVFRHSHTSLSSTDDPKSILMEFAHLPVTVQS